MLAVRSGIPPCELAHSLRPQCAQTLVVKSMLDWNEPLSDWAKSQLVFGAGAWAAVATTSGDLYLVIVLAKQARVENAAMHTRNSIQQLPGSPLVEWVRPLTRRLQRLLGWGDVVSTSAEVTRACKAGDTEELLTLLPQARALIDQGRVDQLPALHDALRSETPALMDCCHQFFNENRFQRIPGPCQRGITYHGPFTRCEVCRLVCCDSCAHCAAEQSAVARDLTYALHEARGHHEWSEEPNGHTLCSMCNASPRDPVEDGQNPVQVFGCPCGARRCKKCLRPSPSLAAPKT